VIPSAVEVRRAVRECLADLPADSLVLVACSGGPDSVALAAAARAERSRAGAVVVDHGLRAGSREEAAATASWLVSAGLDPVAVETVEVGSVDGPEASARRARYAALDAAAARLGAAAVLLGHTRDDQAETVLLGLARGSGVRSLAGMPASRGIYRRPLLATPRSVVRAAVPGSAPVVDDPHNVDDRFARARVRHTVLPVLERELGPGIAEALARTADLARADADLLDALAQETYAVDPDGALPVERLTGLPGALLSRQVRTWLLASGVPAGRAGGRPRAARRTPRDALARPGCGRPAGRCRGAARLWEASRAPHPLVPGAVMDAADLGTQLEKVLVDEEAIAAKVRDLATQIDADYAGKDLLLVGVLKGAVMLMADLSRQLTLPIEMDWMAVSSYGSGTKSSGVVRIMKDLDRDITGKHVLVVEDILDSGLTLSWLLRNLRSRGPASVEVLTMLRKPDAVKVAVDVKYIGFDIPNEFVVGYGLDYAEKYRNLKVVGTLAPHVYS
jgi:tRNA(Ile)-lysidine synthase